MHHPPPIGSVLPHLARIRRALDWKPSLDVRLDAVELGGDGPVRDPPALRRHLLGGPDGQRQVLQPGSVFAGEPAARGRRVCLGTVVEIVEGGRQLVDACGLAEAVAARDQLMHGRRLEFIEAMHVEVLAAAQHRQLAVFGRNLQSLAEGDDRGDAALLVPPARVETVRDALTRSAERLLRDGCPVSLTGPWPPYSFASMDASVDA